MAPDVRVRVFGGLRLRRDGVEVDTGPIRLRTVLAVLLAARGSTVTTAELIGVVWGTRPSASAVNQLQRLIGQVRRLFEPDLPPREPGAWVLPAGDGYRLLIDGSAGDLTAFFELVAAGRAAVRQGDPAGAVPKFEQALATAVEPPFAGLPALTGLPTVVALEAARTEVAAEAAELVHGRPDASRLVPLISRYAAGAALHEPLQARLIRLLTATGRRAEALAHFATVRQRLADELGTDPGPDLRSAHLEALAEHGEPELRRPAHLPPRVAGFTPRDDLSAALDAGRRSSIVVLSGMGGAGKTALAVDWAHRIADDFPDGQLYLDLRGFGPDDRQTRPAEALGALLESLGIDPVAAGDGLEARAARFRSALADRRMIILLDNARESAQVRPLLPASASCLVIVTSRNRLPGLVAHEGARPVHVGRMDRAAARDLLARRLGETRIRSEPVAADALIGLCAGLPLALSMVAAKIAVDHELPLSDAVADIASARRLDALGTGESDDDVRNTFSWSYAALSDPAARLFRLLAVHPGTEVTAEAAVSIAGTQIRAPLAELGLATMVTRLGGGRFTMHDLLHDYASELLEAAGDERAAAERRLVEHYVHATGNAYRTFRLTPPADPGPLPPGVVVPDPPDDAAALDWYAGERIAIRGAVDLALGRGWVREAALIVLHARPLRASTAESSSDSLDQTLRVLRAVEGIADPALETALLREASLGLRRSDPAHARALLSRALVIAEREGDLFWQAQVLRSLGNWPPVLEAGERLDHLRRAVGVARRSGHDSAVVYALEALAKELTDQGGAAEADGHAAEAFELAGAAGMNDFRVGLATRRAEIALRLGDGAKAVELGEWAMANAAPQDNYTLYTASLWLAVAYLRTGRPLEARTAAGLFRELLHRHGDAYAGAFGTNPIDQAVAIIDKVVGELDHIAELDLAGPDQAGPDQAGPDLIAEPDESAGAQSPSR